MVYLLTNLDPFGNDLYLVETNESTRTPDELLLIEEAARCFGHGGSCVVEFSFPRFGTQPKPTISLKEFLVVADLRGASDELLALAGIDRAAWLTAHEKHFAPAISFEELLQDLTDKAFREQS